MPYWRYEIIPLKEVHVHIFLIFVWYMIVLLGNTITFSMSLQREAPRQALALTVPITADSSAVAHTQLSRVAHEQVSIGQSAPGAPAMLAGLQDSQAIPENAPITLLDCMTVKQILQKVEASVRLQCSTASASACAQRPSFSSSAAPLGIPALKPDKDEILASKQGAPRKIPSMITCPLCGLFFGGDKNAFAVHLGSAREVQKFMSLTKADKLGEKLLEDLGKAIRGKLKISQRRALGYVIMQTLGIEAAPRNFRCIACKISYASHQLLALHTIGMHGKHRKPTGKKYQCLCEKYATNDIKCFVFHYARCLKPSGSGAAQEARLQRTDQENSGDQVDSGMGVQEVMTSQTVIGEAATNMQKKQQAATMEVQRAAEALVERYRQSSSSASGSLSQSYRIPVAPVQGVSRRDFGSFLRFSPSDFYDPLDNPSACGMDWQDKEPQEASSEEQLPSLPEPPAATHVVQAALCQQPPALSAPYEPSRWHPGLDSTAQAPSANGYGSVEPESSLEGQAWFQ